MNEKHLAWRWSMICLRQVAAHSKKELLAIHGVGPKAITILGEALAAKGLDYKGEK